MDQHLNASASAAASAAAAAAAVPSGGPADQGQPSAATLVARAADEYLDRLEAGEAPEVDEFVRRFPQVAGVLPQVLPALGLLRSMPPPSPSPVPAVLGEFRILREIGRGGMGVVYEAEQLGLARRVALKLLPPGGGADARALARFQVEARVMAALHHPHIVPVFAVGCDAGVHYYAMQLVDGCSLADRLGRSARDAETARLAPREAAHLAMQAAGALEHAHNLGVLHRDIKPGNLLVEPDGHLWVTDFGLARREGAGDLTRTGDLPGTLRYMSPEQAAGGRLLDPRSDVYSLGATLYELILGRPAFPGNDRADLLRRIAHSDPVPPRRIDPTLPRDLETIVGKAMAREPEHRYATARELAEDLERFLDGRPIRARRPGVLERLGRIPRRHPRASALAASALALAAVASALGLARLWYEQGRTLAALNEARAARRHERQALLFTFAASDQVAGRALARIAGTGNVSRDPAEQARDRSFCRAALDYYQVIAARYRNDPEMPAVVAAADHRIGFIRTILDEPGAEDALTRSIAAYRRLIAVAPGDVALRSALALTYSDLILLQRRAGRPSAVLEAFPPLLELRVGLVEVAPGDVDNLVSLLMLQAEYAGLLDAEGRGEDAASVRRDLVQLAPVAAARVRDAAALNNLAWLVARRPGATRDEAAAAVALAARAVAIEPAAGAYWNTLGAARYRAGDLDASADALRQSMRLRSGGDAYDWLFLAVIRHRQGNAAEARRWLDRSVAWIDESRATRDPDLIRLRDEAARLVGAALAGPRPAG